MRPFTAGTKYLSLAYMLLRSTLYVEVRAARIPTRARPLASTHINTLRGPLATSVPVGVPRGVPRGSAGAAQHEVPASPRFPAGPPALGERLGKHGAHHLYAAHALAKCNGRAPSGSATGSKCATASAAAASSPPRSASEGAPSQRQRARLKQRKRHTAVPPRAAVASGNGRTSPWQASRKPSRSASPSGSGTRCGRQRSRLCDAQPQPAPLRLCERLSARETLHATLRLRAAADHAPTSHTQYVVVM